MRHTQRGCARRPQRPTSHGSRISQSWPTCASNWTGRTDRDIAPCPDKIMNRKSDALHTCDTPIHTRTRWTQQSCKIIGSSRGRSIERERELKMTNFCLTAAFFPRFFFRSSVFVQRWTAYWQKRRSGRFGDDDKNQTIFRASPRSEDLITISSGIFLCRRGGSFFFHSSSLIQWLDI